MSALNHMLATFLFFFFFLLSSLDRFDRLVHVGMYADRESQLEVLKALTQKVSLAIYCVVFYTALATEFSNVFVEDPFMVLSNF